MRGDLLAQENALLNPSTDLFQQEAQMQNRWDRLAAAEELFLRQKSRVQWLKDGDKNTGYFHRVLKVRQTQNRINSLLSETGERITVNTGLKEQIIQYYQTLLGTQNQDCWALSIAEIQRLQHYRCEDSLRQQLASIPTDEEIRNIVFHMPRNKAPGPDGFSVDFYISTWSTIGSDLINAVREFFLHGKLLRQVNATVLSLIPKVKGAERLNEFRPVSCCNTLYKIISKLIASRLALFITDAIQSNQTGFLKGRSISENILLAAELVTKFHKTSTIKRGCLKVDLAKAYDNVCWETVLNTLKALEVLDTLVRWIKECVTTPSFSINFNGELMGYFAGVKVFVT